MKIITKIIHSLYEKKDKFIISRKDYIKLEIVDLITRIKKETEMLITYNEAYQIFRVVKNISKIEGDIAEVGTYKGGTAKLISKAKGNKRLHLFDTFEGLPKIGNFDLSSQFKEGDYSCSLEELQNYFKNEKNIYIYKGVFPKNSELIKDRKFSFVHLDLDLYKGTLESLKFFYPRMNEGGVIISHDYIYSYGVRKAFDEFFKNKITPLIELTESQIMVIKTLDNEDLI